MIDYVTKYRESMERGNHNLAYQLVMSHPEVAAIVRAEELVRLQGYLRSINADPKKLRILSGVVRQNLNRIKPRLEAMV